MKFQKKSAIACLTLFTCVFCHMRVENLLKGHAIGTPLPSLPLWPSPFFMIFPNHLLLTTFFWQYCPNENQIDTKTNSGGKVISSCLENYKTMLHVFLTSNTFISDKRLRFDLKS